MSSSTASPISTNLRYVLDRDWFVRSMDGECVAERGDALVGHNIFTIISDPSLRELLRVLFQKVYDLNKIVYLNYRCDTPELRRYCVMRLERRRIDNGALVCVENRTIVAQARSRVRLLDGTLIRSEERLVMCSWCKKIQMSDTEWSEVEGAVERLSLMKCERLPKLNHGMCPECVDYLSKEAREIEARQESTA